MAKFNLEYFGLAFLLFAATVSARSECFNDEGLLKSICQAQEECARYLRIPSARLGVYNKYVYPNDTQTQRLVRCVGLNLGWWNDTNGVQEPAMRSFFHPDPDDHDYERRTYHCLRSQRLDGPAQPHLDASERAYRSFRCYYEQYGNIVETPQFVRLTPLQQLDVLLQCANLLPFHLPGSSRSCASDTENNFDCLLRCFMLRSGLYSDHYGPNLERVYVQCNNYGNEAEFRETTGRCYRRLKSECLDECLLVGRFLRECFPEGGLGLGTVTSVVPAVTSLATSALSGGVLNLVVKLELSASA